MSTAPLSPSPRPSLSIRSPASSTRTSIDFPVSGQNSLRGTAPTPRRNRAALRDYYNIKAAAASGEAPEQQNSAERGLFDQNQGPLAALDIPGFEAGAYVRSLLEKEGLGGVLKVENELMGEIRGLDGERKALVYDNYSKLIAATDTIRKMRTNMDPLAPATSTLAPAISHIADTTATLSKELAVNVVPPKDEGQVRKEREVQTVRWLLDAPRRLKQKVEDGLREDAEQDWEDIRGLLEKWKAVGGVEEVREACEKVMATVESDD